MQLEKLLERLAWTCVQGNTDCDIKDVVYDSRRAGEGSLFIAIAGAVSDGHSYLPQVISAGAAASHPLCRAFQS